MTGTAFAILAMFLSKTILFKIEKTVGKKFDSKFSGWHCATDTDAGGPIKNSRSFPTNSFLIDILTGACPTLQFSFLIYISRKYFCSIFLVNISNEYSSRCQPTLQSPSSTPPATVQLTTAARGGTRR